jgi:hypothetical protein
MSEHTNIENGQKEREAHDWRHPHTSTPLASGPMGRPRALDDQRKEMVVSLVAKGFSLTQAAAFVACNRDTIRAERKRDPLFDSNLARAAHMRDMEPLNVIVAAARTSWRAAAWIVNYHQKLASDARAQRRFEERLALAEEYVAAREAGADPSGVELPESLARRLASYNALDSHNGHEASPHDRDVSADGAEHAD